MDKIAVISDIHGNLEALNVVLDDIKKRDIDKIICLGDIAGKGMHQEECINLIRKNCFITVKGNNDDFYSNTWDLSEFEEIDRKKYKFFRSKLSNDSVEFLQNLPFSYEFYLSGRLVRLFHAHPEKNYKSIGNIDTIDRLYELFLPSEKTESDNKADIIVYGHIHTPYMQKIYNRFIINAGSVGNSIDVFRNPYKDGNIKNTTLANYVILHGNIDSHDINDNFNFEFINLNYDIDKELLDNDNNIEKDLYEIELRDGTYRDLKKINNSLKIRGIDKEKI